MDSNLIVIIFSQVKAKESGLQQFQHKELTMSNVVMLVTVLGIGCAVGMLVILLFVVSLLAIQD